MQKFVFLTLLVLTLTACDDSVSPIIESSRQYTLFGTLDMARDSQFVRVIPIRDNINEAGDELEVSVRSIELSTQETFVWKDSIHTFADGRVGHIFFAPFRIRPSLTYRIEVTPDDGEQVTSVETTVPDRPVAEIQEIAFAFTRTTQLSARQRILWHGLRSSPYEIEQWYRFLSLADYTFKDYQLSYDPVNSALENEMDVWEMNKDLVQDRDTLSTQLDLKAIDLLAGVALRITLLDDNFVPPSGEFDREILSQPGTLSNVENGFGLLGAIGRFSVEWTIPDSIAQGLGYQPLGNVSTPGGIWEEPPGTYAITQE